MTAPDQNQASADHVIVQGYLEAANRGDEAFAEHARMVASPPFDFSVSTRTYGALTSDERELLVDIDPDGSHRASLMPLSPFSSAILVSTNAKA